MVGFDKSVVFKLLFLGMIGQAPQSAISGCVILIDILAINLNCIDCE